MSRQIVGTVRRVTAFALTVVALAATLAAFQVPAPASALSGSQFDPSNIISDQNFYDSNAMSQAQIQAFLDGKEPSCGNSNCLRLVRTTSTSRAADQMCAAYAGAGSETTAAIIFKVQQACGISAKVLLVTLEKEQGLITATAPSASKLDRAMGYACPDNTATPGWCDPTYGGLYNQLYRAAWQFKRYGNPPGTSNFFTWFPVGSPAPVQYNPAASCGAPVITIKNKATAALYYYTPYQPNPAALANLYGTGDSCSAYGNRNFWVFYNQWFGPTTVPAGTPNGVLDPLTTTFGQINLSGWAFDPDATSASVNIAVQVDSSWASLVANQPNPGSEASYPGSGPNHGFKGSVAATPGPHTVCVYAINVGPGADLALGCQTFTVADASPVGEIKDMWTSTDGISMWGWAYDPDSLGTAVPISIQVDSKWYLWQANQPYAVLEQTYPGVGQNHGWGSTIPAAGGDHTVCIYLGNKNGGSDSSLGCRTVTVPGGNPKGEIKDMWTTEAGISLWGWAYDPDVLASPVSVSVQVDSSWYSWTANQPYAVLEQTYPGVGQNHGWGSTVPAAAGNHTVCVYLVNQGPGADTSLGCRTVTVPGGNPKGEIKDMWTTQAGISLWGWAYDPDVLASPVAVSIQVDSNWYLWQANQPYAVLEQTYPGVGQNHGWGSTVPAAAGNHTVCVYLVNQGPGTDTSLGCRTVTVPGGNPKGEIKDMWTTPGGISLWGWAYDPDVLASPVSVSVQVDSSWYSWTANQSYAVLEQTYPGVGQNHGWGSTVPAAAGNHTVCVYLVNQGPGTDTSLGCRTVNVPGSPPQGEIKDMWTSKAGVSLWGWAFDRDMLSGTVQVSVQVDSSWYLWPANQPYAVLEQTYPGVGQNHGWGSTAPATPGAHTVCVYLVNLGPGTDSSLGCRAVTVPSS